MPTTKTAPLLPWTQHHSDLIKSRTPTAHFRVFRVELHKDAAWRAYVDEDLDGEVFLPIHTDLLTLADAKRRAETYLDGNTYR